MKNYAFVDGQNLYMNTKANNWNVDLKKFCKYLREKYNVDKAYYFLGAIDDSSWFFASIVKVCLVKRRVMWIPI